MLSSRKFKASFAQQTNTYLIIKSHLSATEGISLVGICRGAGVHRGVRGGEMETKGVEVAIMDRKAGQAMLPQPAVSGRCHQTLGYCEK